jgi:anti-sigma regulatory factor (Ser/Thr protein kinase)
MIVVHSDMDIASVRSAARTLARAQGFSVVDQARIATITSHLTRTFLRSAGAGDVTLRAIEYSDEQGFEFVFQQRSSDSPLLNYLVQEGNMFLAGPVTGIPDAKQFMDEFEIHSREHEPTMVICRKWRR